MLRDGQRPQRAIKRASRARHVSLVDEELAVVEPDARHLVHEGEGSLEGAVRRLVRRVGGARAVNLVPAQLQIGVPGAAVLRLLAKHQKKFFL